MRRKNKYSMKNLPVNAPLYHTDHSRPVTRRDFIRQGFALGSASYLSGSIFSLFATPNEARAALSSDLIALAEDHNCTFGSDTGGVGMICFDLAGGANFAGSNVLVGGAGGQNDETITTAGYSKLGIPGDMIPGLDSSAFDLRVPNSTGFVNDDLGLLFHADSALLAGILEKAGAAIGHIDGCVIPARSENDTANNPHNPLYGVAMTGAKGSVVDLIGSRNSESGGNSFAPANMVNPKYRPTKVDNANDVTGMVDVGDLTATLSNPADVTAVMESMARITHKKLKLGNIDTGLGIDPITGFDKDAVIKDMVRCGYLKAAELADRFAGIAVNPKDDAMIQSIFNAIEMEDNEFEKTASIMKMVINGYSAAGCITIGGYDYHTGDRSTGESRDLRAGRCIGACLNYAEQVGKPLMIYVYSDGSVASNGTRDDSVGGRGKGVWSGDNSSTACSFFLVFKPGGDSKPNLLIPGRQIGRFSSDASVVTSSSPAANNVNLLVNTVLLNYMALNNQLGKFATTFPGHGLGSGTSYEQYVAFDPIV